MRTRIIIALLILAIGYWIISNQSMTSKTYKATNIEQTINQKNTKDPIENTKTKKLKEKVKKKVKALQIPDNIAQELSQQKYSDEPLLEIATVSFLFDDCKKRMNTSYSHLEYSEIRESLFLKFKDNCQNVVDDYPTLTQSQSKKETEMLMLKVALQSKYAEMIERAMGIKYLALEQKQEFLMEAIKLVYSSKNAKIIAFMGEIPLSDETILYYNQLFKTLGTIDPVYTKLILSQASILFSCQYNNGITCSPTSIYMLKQCFEYKSACGLDVQTWFNIHNTPAHNRDIAKIVDFFENIIQ